MKIKNLSLQKMILLNRISLLESRQPNKENHNIVKKLKRKLDNINNESID